MLFFLWSILNVGLVIFFFVLCFKATRLVRENIGIFAAIVFAIGLLSFIGSSHKTGESTTEVKKWSFYPKDSVAAHASNYTDKIIYKNGLFELDLGIMVGEELSTKHRIAIEATSVMRGLVSGYAWQPHMLVVQRNPTGSQFNYQVDGILKWNLIGLTIYSQSKSLSGSFESK